ncbi:MAG: hypothetical protein AAF805_14280 [Planctomycetota bacterium]
MRSIRPLFFVWSSLLGAAVMADEAGERSVLVVPPLIAVDTEPIAADEAVEPIEELLPTPTPAAGDPATRAVAEEVSPDAAGELRASLAASHAWTRFEPGAWRRTQTLSDAFDAEGAFVGRSLTERTERLVSVEGARYTVRVDTVVDLAGRRTAGPSELIERSVFTDRPTGRAAARIRELDPASVGVAGLATPCRVWEVRWATAAGAESQRVYLAGSGPVAVLRRESRTPAEGEPLVTNEAVVVLTDAPIRVGEELASGWHVATTSSRATGAVTRGHEVLSTIVPGGLHRRSVVEYDGLGHRSRWAVTELLAWGRDANDTVEASPLASGNSGDSLLEPGVRPRRLMRMLRRAERANAESAAP